MSEFTENVTLTLEHYEQLKGKIEDLQNKLKELQNDLIQVSDTVSKFTRPLIKMHLSDEQYEEFLKQIERGEFEASASLINSLGDDPMTAKIGYMIKIKKGELL